MHKMFDINLPGLHYFSKNLKSQYSLFSENFAEIADLHSEKEALGKSDFDFYWKENAPFFVGVDQKIISEGLLYFSQLEILPLQGRIANILTTKYPVLDKNHHPIGVAGYFIELTDCFIVKKNGYYDKITGRFYFNKHNKERYLTPRELEVLRLLMIGYHSKKIALILKISKRTVEEYIDHLRLKMDCLVNSDIVPNAFLMGLNHLIFSIPRMLAAAAKILDSDFSEF